MSLIWRAFIVHLKRNIQRRPEINKKFDMWDFISVGQYSNLLTMKYDSLETIRYWHFCMFLHQFSFQWITLLNFKKGFIYKNFWMMAVIKIWQYRKKQNRICTDDFWYIMLWVIWWKLFMRQMQIVSFGWHQICSIIKKNIQ